LFAQPLVKTKSATEQSESPHVLSLREFLGLIDDAEADALAR
jgi:hypothetical protein